MSQLLLICSRNGVADGDRATSRIRDLLTKNFTNILVEAKSRIARSRSPDTFISR